VTKETFIATNNQQVFELSSQPISVTVFGGRTHLIEGASNDYTYNSVDGVFLNDGALLGTTITVLKHN